jgi:lactate dehydrogenase-like 2-hydroxyacid dehydrogenase
MKPGAVLVNIGAAASSTTQLCRGAVRGRIAAAGLDVYENEPALNPGLLELKTSC